MSVDYDWAKALTEQLKSCQAEISRLRLTDEERAVLTDEAELAEYQQRQNVVVAIRGLLERTGCR